MFDLNNIDVIVFDIGNVIVDIDYETMIAEFKKIAREDFHHLIGYHHQQNFFDRFERGEITAREFRDTLRQFLKEDVTDAEIDHAWDSILVGYPIAKFDLLDRLRSSHRVVALSNINEIHVNALDRYTQRHFAAPDMRSYFHHAYYSNEVGHRKPEPQIYELLVQKENADPARMLFIDDKAENTNAAAALGIQVHHLENRDSLVGLFRL